MTVVDSHESSHGYSSEECSWPETWYKCLPSCPITCDSIRTRCRSIAKTCRSGCDCAYGFARKTRRGPCVPIKRCPGRLRGLNQGDISLTRPYLCSLPTDYEEEDKCPRHEVQSDCGDRCKESCDRSKVCATRCTKGCFCKAGYARIRGVCKPRDQCDDEDDSRNCAANEEYTKCGRSCTEQCVSSGARCSSSCTRGCFCKAGFVRINGKCVDDKVCREDDCPFDERHLDCGRTCNEKCDPKSEPCSTRCKSGCFCQEGEVRINNRCVSRSMCGSNNNVTCNVNEVENACSIACRDSCDERACLFDRTPCKRGCSCIEGYKRIQGVCLRASECSTTGGQCSTNEVWDECANDCKDSCNKDCVAAQFCSRRCVCAGGLKRVGSRCVPESQCPTVNTCTRPNESIRCSNRCAESCNPSPTCPTTGPCSTECFCNPGFSRDSTGLCVLTTSCTKTCLTNEVLNPSGNICDDDCTPTRACSLLPRAPTCNCAPGFKRIRGVCQLAAGCTCRGNQVFRLGNLCTQRCPIADQVCGTGEELGCYCPVGLFKLELSDTCFNLATTCSGNIDLD